MVIVDEDGGRVVDSFGLVEKEVGVGDGGFNIGADVLEVGGGVVKGVIEVVIIDHFANGTFAFGNLGGDGLEVGDGGGERALIGFEEVC